MTGMGAALLEAHRKNFRRYCHLLTTDLTDLEREFIHRRLAETRLAMDRLELGDMPPADFGGLIGTRGDAEGIVDDIIGRHPRARAINRPSPAP